MTTKKDNRCIHCNSDLTQEDSVSRKYVSPNKEDLFCSGHYTPEGYFEPDESIFLGDSYDLMDDSDSCSSCYKQNL